MIYQMFNRMVRVSVGAGPYGLPAFPTEDVFGSMLFLPAVHEKINDRGVPAHQVWHKVVETMIDSKYGPMIVKPKKVGWIKWLIPSYDERTIEEVGKDNIDQAKNSVWEPDGSKFSREVENDLKQLQPEPVVWSLCKHFPWVDVLKGNEDVPFDEMSEEQRQEHVINTQWRHEKVRMKYLRILLDSDPGAPKGGHLIDTSSILTTPVHMELFSRRPQVLDVRFQTEYGSAEDHRSMLETLRDHFGGGGHIF